MADESDRDKCRDFEEIKVLVNLLDIRLGHILNCHACSVIAATLKKQVSEFKKNVLDKFSDSSP